MALTNDELDEMWSVCNMMPYMSLTEHSIDKHWALQTKCLQGSHVQENRTAENLKEALQTAIQEWQIHKKKNLLRDHGQRSKYSRGYQAAEMAVVKLFRP